MKPDSRKTEAIRTWPTPSDVGTVRQFLGLVSYYRRYIKGFADIAAPLYALTQKGVKFEWTEACETAFLVLKKKLTADPILAYPRFDKDAKPFTVYTDASSIGLGAVLEQDGHVVAYARRVLTKPEQQYSVIQQECLAVVYALKQFRHYLLGRFFELETDHQPLQWLSDGRNAVPFGVGIAGI